MKRVGPHVVAIIGALLCGWRASLIRQVGAEVSNRNLSMSWSHYIASLSLWTLAGFFLALPHIIMAIRVKRGLTIQWLILAVYVVPGLLFMLILPLYMAAGTWGLTWLPTAWMPTYERYGGDLVGGIITGYGLAQSLIGTQQVE